ncbi:glycosyltransferase family A protein [Chryseobacterium sp.]|uniref:glycosyltransferase family 2 protein n=1 Tax=Chryseobacterium sp. TaxID=1871047 RepID=UPI0025C2FAA8|nr:glycosyltransferase family A protein [Chryseobacterium sp.]
MVSVIIPLYNAEKTIQKALDSVRTQTYPAERFEVIIINDGSTDASRLVVLDYIESHPDMNIRLIDQNNGGVSKARNTGLKEAIGDYIALLDSDDEWLPEKTKHQIEFLERRGWVIDFLACRRNNSEILFPYKVKDGLAEITFNKLLIRNEAQPSTVIFKRKILKNTGYFDDNQRYTEDVNYWLKIALKNKMYILDESLVIAGGGKRTFGASGLSADLSSMEKGYRKNLKEMYGLRNITALQYLALRVFYKVKYLFLQCRQIYYNTNKIN